MIIYIDTLIFLNTIIDYIILLLTCLITKRNYSLMRLVLASLLGGISSLYILIGNTLPIIDVLYKLLSGLVIVIVAHRYSGLKNLFIMYLTFMIIGFSLCGGAEFAENLFRSKVVNENFISYFEISPLLLISITVLIYLTVLFIRKILERNSFSRRALLIINLKDFKKKYTAIVDTGSDLRDPFSDAEVFVLNNVLYDEIKLLLEFNEFQKRQRLIPATTINGSALMEGIRCDEATIIANDKTMNFYNPIVICSERMLNDTDAIISYTSLNRLSDKRGLI